MDNRLIGEESRPEYAPEEVALLMRIRVFITMRWLAVIGVIMATLVASEVFNIGFPTTPVYILCAFMAIYNSLNLEVHA